MEAKVAEESFRSSLDDVVTILERVAPLCKSHEELLDMLRLARENMGQLRLLMQTVMQRGR